jgi:hypothetical protein
MIVVDQITTTLSPEFEMLGWNISYIFWPKPRVIWSFGGPSEIWPGVLFDKDCSMPPLWARPLRLTISLCLFSIKSFFHKPGPFFASQGTFLVAFVVWLGNLQKFWCPPPKHVRGGKCFAAFVFVGGERGGERDSYIQSLMLCSSAMNYRAGFVTAI